MSDLATRLLAEIERREANGNEVGQLIGFDAGWKNTIRLCWTEPEGTGYLFDSTPADALRRYAHYRRVLERHRLAEYGNGGPIYCAGCSVYDSEMQVFRALIGPEFCREVPDVAAALGIEVSHDGQ